MYYDDFVKTINDMARPYKYNCEIVVERENVENYIFVI